MGVLVDAGMVVGVGEGVGVREGVGVWVGCDVGSAILLLVGVGVVGGTAVEV